MDLKTDYDTKKTLDFKAGWDGNLISAKDALMTNLPKYSVIIKQGARTIRTMGTDCLDLLVVLKGLAESFISLNCPEPNDNYRVVVNGTSS